MFVAILLGFCVVFLRPTAKEMISILVFNARSDIRLRVCALIPLGVLFMPPAIALVD